MQYNLDEIWKLIDEIENKNGRYKTILSEEKMFSTLRAKLISLNRYVEAVATIGAMALAMEDE